MKKIILFATAIMMASCGFMQNSTSNVQSNNVQSTTTSQTTAQTGNAAVSAGQGAGNALQALYAQYKADGKYDYKNMQNILNTVTLVANCEGLKDNYKDKTYLKEFGKGMIASSLGLVTQNNVQTVTNSLVEMVKSNETVQNATTKVQEGASSAASYANTAAQYASSISSILSLFK
ncbi:MAG: hypothetical protein IJR42_06210 [Paludibacteraceae bacterium]|nr:hypothetical protein [Paludibacteraceae bacterium]